MSGLTASRSDRAEGGSNALLFFRRWLANPLQMGSVIPSSPALCRRIAALVERKPDEVVVELGAGTGVVSRALLAAGVPAEKLVVVEIVPEMAEHLRDSLPGVQVVCGDAFALPDGYLYVTRGLLVLANDSSEVAAVLVLTDGYISFPAEEPPYAVLWGLVDGMTNFHPAYGTVVQVKT